MEKCVKKKRRYFSKAQKMEILKDFDQGTTCTSLAEQHRISPVLIYRWRKSMAKQQSFVNHSKQNLFSIEKVGDELKAIEDDLSKWAKEVKSNSF